MTCSDIHRVLKNFQDDMLPDEEYQAFVSHLDTCVQCSLYVSQFGFLSNQIWELGNVRVPSDLASSILFALKNPQPKVRAPQWRIPGFVRFVPGRMVWAGLAAVLVVAAFLFGQSQKGRDDAAGRPKDSTGAINANQYVSPAPAGKDQIVTPPPKEEPPLELYAYVTVPSAKAPAPVFKTLHWHLGLAATPAEQDEDSVPQLERDVRQKIVELNVLVDEISRLKAEDQFQFKQHYSPDTDETAIRQARDRARSLAEKLERKNRLESEIKNLKAQRERIELVEREKIVRQRCTEEECRSRLLSALGLWRVSAGYNAGDVVVFTAAGTKVEQILRQILLIDRAPCTLSDFTRAALIMPDEVYHVSVSLGPADPNIRHWHMRRASGLGKSAMEEVIKQISGRVKHASQDNLVFSLPAAVFDEFKKRLQARGLGYSEYGEPRAESNIFVSSPVTISVYFTD